MKWALHYKSSIAREVIHKRDCIHRLWWIKTKSVMEMLAWRGMKWAIEKIINYKDEHRQGTVECVCEVVDVIVFCVVWPPTFVHSHSAPMHNKNNNIQREEISAQLLTLRLLLTCDASVPREKINVILSMRKKRRWGIVKEEENHVVLWWLPPIWRRNWKGVWGAMYMLQRQEKTVGAKGCKSVKYNKILW